LKQRRSAAEIGGARNVLTCDLMIRRAVRLGLALRVLNPARGSITSAWFRHRRRYPAGRRLRPRRRSVFPVRAETGDEHLDLTVIDGADADATFESRIIFGIGLVIGHIEIIVLVDEDCARPAELFPFFEKTSILIENLHTIVTAIADEDSSFGIHAMACGTSNSPGAAPFLPHALMNFPSFENFTARALDSPPCPSATIVTRERQGFGKFLATQ
jgi:hypothetical protein